MGGVESILESFGLRASEFEIARFGSGHIHQTYSLKGARSFVLQRVNKNVFKNPERIAANIRVVSNYLKHNHPDYLFLVPIPTVRGNETETDDEGFPWRLFPFIDDTFAMDQVGTEREAHLAARAFAELTLKLDKLDPSLLDETIPHFHDLSVRFRQFESAVESAERKRIAQAEDSIRRCNDFLTLVKSYRVLREKGTLRRRITHNDSKINNVLFHSVSHEPVCVIDLDTLMPGYFIYDLGDMVRTFVCPVSEEERDLSKIVFRKEMYNSLTEGYLSQMGSVMSPDEMSVIPFAGKMMTFIMALRFLTDYLNGDKYYHIKYPEQNLVRASNQLRLLEVLEENC